MGFKVLYSATLLAVVGFSFTGSAYAQKATDTAQQAVSLNPSESASAVATLRAKGPAGLQEFLDTHLTQLSSSQPNLLSPKLTAALDALCQQRDCYASRLYWYTNLEQAKAAAKATGKPILSLRLLGRLDQDLSCANSRFFRIALYPNAAVSQVLRDRFILHWQSVRPVPQVTIDFGDGRQLKRTLTGNSIHYILDAAGRPIEALPGLYGPQAFLRALTKAEQVVKQSAELTGQARQQFLNQYYQNSLAQLQTQQSADLSELGITAIPTLALPSTPEPTAEEAGRLAISKMAVENPVLSSISRNPTPVATADDATWESIAKLHSQDAKLDSNSIALIRRKNPQASQLSNGKITKSSASDPLLPVIQKFESLMAVDTVRNEYLLHTQLYQWLIEDRGQSDVAALNERVYAQLFLTPSSDPWLGLLPNDTYTAIENDGISQPIGNFGF